MCLEDVKPCLDTHHMKTVVNTPLINTIRLTDLFEKWLQVRIGFVYINNSVTVQDWIHFICSPLMKLLTIFINGDAQ